MVLLASCLWPVAMPGASAALLQLNVPTDVVENIKMSAASPTQHHTTCQHKLNNWVVSTAPRRDAAEHVGTVRRVSTRAMAAGGAVV